MQKPTFCSVLLCIAFEMALHLRALHRTKKKSPSWYYCCSPQECTKVLEASPALKSPLKSAQKRLRASGCAVMSYDLPPQLRHLKKKKI